MYLRSTAQKRKDGSVVRYLQLAHNVWDPVPTALGPGWSTTSAGRMPPTGPLWGGWSVLCRALSPGEALLPLARRSWVHRVPTDGGACVLDPLWHQLGLTPLPPPTPGRRLDAPPNGSCSPWSEPGSGPSSKLAGALGQEVVAIPGPPIVRRSVLPGDGLADGGRRRARPAGLPPVGERSSTWKSTCSSSTPPPPTSRLMRPTRRCGATHAADVRARSRTRARQHPGFRTFGQCKDHRADLP